MQRAAINQSFITCFALFSSSLPNTANNSPFRRSGDELLTHVRGFTASLKGCGLVC